VAECKTKLDLKTAPALQGMLVQKKLVLHTKYATVTCEAVQYQNYWCI